LAALIVFTSSQVHENGLVYGGSLCLAMGLLDWRTGTLKPSRGVAALGLLGGLWLLALVGQKYLGPTPEARARDMLAQLADNSLSSYVGVYFTVGGFRTIVSSACFTFRYAGSYFNVASVFAFLAAYGIILPAFSRLRLGLLLLVGFLPMTVLTIIAVDYGRWLSFAVLNWWLINAALQLREIEPLAIDRWPPRTSMLAGVAVLLMGPGTIGVGSAITGKIAEKIWHGRDGANGLAVCDPTWMDVVKPPAK
jgi:hypothetical protein